MKRTLSMKRILSMLVAVALIVSVFSVVAYASNVVIAGTPVTGRGMITGNGVNFRRGPGTSYEPMFMLYYGEKGRLSYAYPSYPNPTWYRMKMTEGSHKGKEGWAYSFYVEATNVTTTS